MQFTVNGEMNTSSSNKIVTKENAASSPSPQTRNWNPSSVYPLMLVVVVLLLFFHSGALLFIYAKILRLETSLERRLEISFPRDQQSWATLLEEKARDVIERELLSHRQLSAEPLLSSSSFHLDDSDSHSSHKTSSGLVEEYPKGPVKVSLPKKSPAGKSLLTPVVDEGSSQRGSDASSRDKRNVHHRRQYRDEGDVTGDELSVQLQGQSSDETADQSWLQLTSYARIPSDVQKLDTETRRARRIPLPEINKQKVQNIFKRNRKVKTSMFEKLDVYNAIQEFCSKTKASCPPGPEGPQGPIGERGPQGMKGEVGDRGLPGIQGPRGPTGLSGIPGPPGLNGRKGEMGPSGIPGLDGRDGLPGEPGLDGIPGRNGLDGIPGVDGIPGFDGLPGHDGRNGTNGRPGEKGRQGDRGPIGPRGIAGPRGRAGKNGAPGIPGVPGINTWMINGTEVKKILIPPSIPGTKRRRKTIVVNEKENVRLRCQAAGEPPPKIEWTREDGMAIATGQWKDGSLVSSLLNLTHIRRDHTGRYRCEAYNGIPPNDFKTFDVEVHFNPYVRVNNWNVGTYNGSSATLECHVEAFPIAVTYWEDRLGRILEDSHKYRVQRHQDSKFIWKGSMLLQILDITSEDFGHYHCVAKNELSLTRGMVKVHEIDPNRYVPPSTGTVDGLTFGPDPPNYSELFNDLCPPPVICKTCPKTAKSPPSRGSLYCLRVQQFGNDTYPGFRNRSLDCELSAVGKPVYHRHTDSEFGSWMRDPLPRDTKAETRYWTTTPDNPHRLFEYADKIKYRKNQSTRNYSLPYPFEGNSHVVYNGSFFYQQKNSKKLIKYEMISGRTQKLYVPKLFLNKTNYLYNGGRDFVDLATDENGLWAIYGLPESNNTVVMKLDPWNLRVEYSWNISLSHRKFGEMFITCGVLYGIDSSTERDTKIRFALDLFKKNILDVNLPFTNPFRKTTMLGYNPLTKEIYSWDDGNQLTYPIKYIDIGYNTPFDERGNDAKARTKLMEYESDYDIGDFSSG